MSYDPFEKMTEFDMFLIIKDAVCPDCKNIRKRFGNVYVCEHCLDRRD